MKSSCFTLPGHKWLVALKQLLGMDLTAARGCRQMRGSSQSHKSQLRTSSQRQMEMKFFIEALSTVQLASPDVCISFFLPASGKPDASLRRRLIRCRGQALAESITKPALYSFFVANPRGLKLGVEVNLNFPAEGRSCLLKPHTFVADPSKPRAFFHRSHA